MKFVCDIIVCSNWLLRQHGRIPHSVYLNLYMVYQRAMLIGDKLACVTHVFRMMRTIGVCNAFERFWQTFSFHVWYLSKSSVYKICVHALLSAGEDIYERPYKQCYVRHSYRAQVLTFSMVKAEKFLSWSILHIKATSKKWFHIPQNEYARRTTLILVRLLSERQAL